jgi:hypothetical protein
MAFSLIDSYKRSDGYECTLEHDPSTQRGPWRVTMWNADDECHWQLSGYTKGGVSDGFRTVGGEWCWYTEDEARKEFEKWR